MATRASDFENFIATRGTLNKQQQQRNNGMSDVWRVPKPGEEMIYYAMHKPLTKSVSDNSETD